MKIEKIIEEINKRIEELEAKKENLDLKQMSTNKREELREECNKELDKLYMMKSIRA